MGEPEKAALIVFDKTYPGYRSVALFLGMEEQNTAKEWWRDWYIGINVWFWTCHVVFARQSRPKHL